MTLTKKSEAIQKQPDSLRTVEVKPIEAPLVRPTEPDLHRKENPEPLAYRLGKIAGWVLTFLPGFLKTASRFNTGGNGDSQKEGNRRLRSHKMGRQRRGKCNGKK